jgi:hypothetical protein
LKINKTHLIFIKNQKLSSGARSNKSGLFIKIVLAFKNFFGQKKLKKAVANKSRVIVEVISFNVFSNFACKSYSSPHMANSWSLTGREFKESEKVCLSFKLRK